MGNRSTKVESDPCCFLIKLIIKCYEDRYRFENDIDNEDETTNDHLVFQIYEVLNLTAWSLFPNTDDNNEEILCIQMNLVSNV